jgi:hypothetical protein
MPLKQPRKTAFVDIENVEAIAAGVAADDRAPGGEWYVRMGPCGAARPPSCRLTPSGSFRSATVRQPRPTSP